MSSVQRQHTTMRGTLPPGSFGLPVVGETISFFRDKNFFARRQQRYGSIFKTHLFGHPTVVVIGPEATRPLLTDLETFSWANGWPPGLRALLANSILVQDGAEHKRVRQALAPAFQGKALRGYMATMERIVRAHLVAWEQKGTFNWVNEAHHFTFDTAAELLMGWPAGTRETAYLSRRYQDYFAGTFSIPLNLPWTRFRRSLQARKELLSNIEQVIRRKMAAAEPGHDMLSYFLRMSIENQQTFTIDELKEQAIALMLGSHETTTALLTSLLFVLSCRADLLARLRDEQGQLAGMEPITFEHLEAMPYLDMVLNEAERLYSPAGGGFRGVEQPVELGGYFIPKGWKAHYRIPELHCDPVIYTNPNEFDPERFAPGHAEGTGKRAFTFMTYGGGPRTCLGISFARLEIKLLLAHLLRSYQWTLQSEVTFAHLPTNHVKQLHVQFSRLN